jgi:hypothetical protein
MKNIETIDISEKQIESWLKEFDCSLEKGHYKILFDGTATSAPTVANTQNSSINSSNKNANKTIAK